MNTRVLIRSRKFGVSSTVAAILLATISVTLVGTTYFFSKGVMEKAMAETFEVIDIFQNKVIIRNTGTQKIEELKTLVDGKEVSNVLEPLEPGSVGSLTLNLTGIPAGRHELTIISRSMSQTLAWEFEYVTEVISEASELEAKGVDIKIETQQGEAEVGKPVKWVLKLSFKNPTENDIKDYVVSAILPSDASNILIKDEEENIVSKEESFTIDVQKKSSATYFIEYETPAPYKIEEEGSIFFRKGYVKTIRVISNASVDYENVKVSSPFPYRNFRLYHILNFRFYDATYPFPLDVTHLPTYKPIYENGRVEWVVPRLSEQVFVLTAEEQRVGILATYDITLDCGSVTSSCECVEWLECTSDADCNISMGRCSVSCPDAPPNSALANNDCSSTATIVDDCADNSCVNGACAGDGTCSVTCSAPTGACYYNCNSGYGNCDGDDSNGCETDLNTDPNNCGACGNSCGPNAYCDNGNCACNPGWYNEDGDWSNGCENAPPRWFSPSVNKSNPEIRDVISFNVNWTDNTGVNTSFGLGVSFTILSLNGTGESCDEWGNVSIKDWNNPQSVWSNLTWQIPDRCAGKTIAWRQYANDSANRWNVTTERTITVAKGWLNVTLLEPNPSTCNETNPCEWCAYFIKDIEVEVECKESRCGAINTTARRNSTTSDLIPISLSDGDQPFYILNDTNTVTFDLNAGEKKRILWEVNVSSCILVPWKINSFSNASSTIQNETKNATIKIVSGSSVSNVSFNVSEFQIHDPLNCSANVTDPKNKTLYVYYEISDHSGLRYSGKIYDHETGLDNCEGDGNWTNGEICSVIIPDTVGFKGDWECKITAQCICGNTSAKGPNATMINTPPPKSKVISPANDTWFNMYQDFVDVTCENISADQNLEDTLTFTIQNSSDKVTWSNICVNDQDGTCAWNLVGLSDGFHYLRCYASDGTDVGEYSDPITVRIDRTPPTCILNITNITHSPYSLKGVYEDALSGMANVTYLYFNGTDWKFLYTNSTPPYTYDWNVSEETPSLENKWIFVNVTCNDTVGNDVTNQSYVAVDLENTAPSVWNLIVRDDEGKPLSLNTTNPGVLIMITVNSSDPDPVRGIDYIEGNFTDVNDGYSDYGNFSEEITPNYTHVWNYTLRFDAGPGQAYINVTVYDKDGAFDRTSTNITINEFAEVMLSNIPVNFSFAFPTQEVNATPLQGWPLNISIGGNVPLNLSQNGSDLVGEEDPSFAIKVGNISWSTGVNGLFKTLSYFFEENRIAENKQPGESQPVYYKLYIPSIIKQRYEGVIYIKGEFSS